MADIEEVPFPPDAVEVARISGAWGLQGGIKVKPFSGDPQALFSTKRWFLQPPTLRAGLPAGPSRKAVAHAWPRLLRIVHAREQGDQVVATAEGLSDRDAAQALKGARIFVSRASFPTPDADEFYWVDLIGLDVRNREGLRLGMVAGLIETGPSCVLRVVPGPVPGDSGEASAIAPQAADECLIPFASAYVDQVDLPGRCVHVDWQTDYG